MSRELDAALAEALGWDATLLGEDGMMWSTTGENICTDLPYCSTDGNDMLKLDRAMRKRGFLVTIDYIFNQGYFVSLFEKIGETYNEMADTMPMAYALAAYKALTGKEWVG